MAIVRSPNGNPSRRKYFRDGVLGRRPDGSITVSTITATLTAGGNLPTADTWSIVLACSGDCSGISFSNKNLSSVLSGCCANRVFDFTAVNGTGSGSNITLTPAGDGFTGTIEGGDTTPGTPYIYIPASTNLMTYTGTDSTNLPGVAAFTDKAVTVDGDAVPVRAIYNYVSGSYVTVQFSRQLTTLVGDDGSEMSGTFERIFFHGTSMGASSDTAIVDIEFGGASGATDKVIYAGGTSGFIDDDTNAVEAFQFPMLAGPDTLRDPLIFSPMLLRLA